MRLPTLAELDEGYNEMERQAAIRAAVFAQAHIKDRPMTDAAVELRAAGIEPIEAPAEWITPVVNVNTWVPAPRPPAPKPGAPPTEFYCGSCGKVYSSAQYKTPGMAKMQRTRHERRDHAVAAPPPG